MRETTAPRSAIVVLAAGSGSRVGATADGVAVNKVLLPINGVPILVRSVCTALDVPGVQQVVVVVRPGEAGTVAQALHPYLGTREVLIVVGGSTRHESEWQALQVLAGDVLDEEIDVIAIHDGARPIASTALYAEIIARAHEHGGALPVVPADALVGAETSLPAAENHALAAVQTPQAFRAELLMAAYQQASEEGFIGTDTASALEWYQARNPNVRLRLSAVASSPLNIKVTYPEDVALAEQLLD